MTSAPRRKKKASATSAAAGKPSSPAGTTSGVGVSETWIRVFEQNECVDEHDRLTDKQISEFRSSYPPALEFAYKFQRGRKPFSVDAIYHDGRFTYIKASPDETPALYELRDGKPNLVNFDFQDGAFVVPKVLETGYLAIGKQKMGFEREDR